MPQIVPDKLKKTLDKWASLFAWLDLYKVYLYAKEKEEM